MEVDELAARHDLTRRCERRYLVHLWLCVLFALAWAVFPGWLGRPEDVAVSILAGLRGLYSLTALVLMVRTWWAWNRPPGAAPHLAYVWPIFDSAVITAALAISRPEPDSWAVMLYVLPIIQAAFTRQTAFALGVGVLASLSWLMVQGPSGLGELRYAYFAFQTCFFAILASLLTHLTQSLGTAEAALARLESQRRLANGLHDGVQQSLVAIALRLDVLALTVGQSDPAKQAAARESEAIRHVNDELRLLVRRTAPDRPVMPTPEAVQLLAQWFEQRTGIGVEVKWDAPWTAIAPAEESLAFRACQEGLTNAAKHGSAERITITLRQDEICLEILIEDDGAGIAPNSAWGYGLETLSTGARDRGGELSLAARADRGTRLRLVLPRTGSPA